MIVETVFALLMIIDHEKGALNSAHPIKMP